MKKSVVFLIASIVGFIIGSFKAISTHDCESDELKVLLKQLSIEKETVLADNHSICN